MRSFIKKFAVLALVALAGVAISSGNIYADEEQKENNSNVATSISISPVSKILQLAPNSTYEDNFVITNNGNAPLNFEVYAAPYGCRVSGICCIPEY